MADKTTPPRFLHYFGRAIGIRFRGTKGVDRFLRTLHSPDHRQNSWMETVAIALPDGPKYYLATCWWTEWTTWFYGQLDRQIHEWIAQHARPDWVAFDIGMNFGYYACLLGQRCAAVHGFEPVPWLAKRSRLNVELNGFQNVSISEFALSEQSGEASLNLPPEDDANWGTSSLVHQCRGKTTLKVQLETIDNYTEAKFLTRLDFIKIDVEGAEHLVLKGALKTLKRHKPIIIFERNPESFESAVEILRSLDYGFYDLNEKPLGDNTEKYPPDMLAMPGALQQRA